MKQDILMVDDDPAILQFMARTVSSFGCPRIATDGLSALRIANERTPDLVLLDAEMPGMDGFQVCRAMKADQNLKNVPIIFVTSHDEPEFEVAGLDVGADDFIAKPFAADRLISRIKARLRSKWQFDAQKQLAMLDSLTALPNLPGFRMQLHREWRRGLRAGTPISLLHAEVDHFAAYQERHGLASVQECVRRIATAIGSNCKRPADFVARVSNSKFAILLPHTPRKGAEHFAHRVLDAVESASIPHAASPSARHVTVSVGLSTYDEQTLGWVEPSSESRHGGLAECLCSQDDLVEASQGALFAASSAGHAQAWFLDASDCSNPRLAREVDPMARAAIKRRRRGE